MKAIVVRKHGAPEVLQIEEVPDPAPGEGEILIEVYAASVNPIDWKIRKGIPRFLDAYPLPFTPGADVSGVVTAVGSGVTRFSVGDEVYALLDRFLGGYAERVVCRAEIAAPKPTNLSHIEAASIPGAGLTALQGLGDLRQGQKVLINGASGGVGHFAVQIAKAAGCEVTEAGSQTGELKGRFDLVFDAVGLLSPAKCTSILKKDGLYVSTLPTPSGFFSKFLGLIWRGPRAITMQVEPDGEALARLKVEPTIAATFPLDQVAQAHEMSEAGHVHGKIVLIVRP